MYDPGGRSKSSDRVSRSLIPGNFTIDGNFFKFPILKLFSISQFYFQFWSKILESNFSKILDSWKSTAGNSRTRMMTLNDLSGAILLYWIPISKKNYLHHDELEVSPGYSEQSAQQEKITNRYMDGKWSILERVCRIWFMKSRENFWSKGWLTFSRLGYVPVRRFTVR